MRACCYAAVASTNKSRMREIGTCLAITFCWLPMAPSREVSTRERRSAHGAQFHDREKAHRRDVGTKQANILHDAYAGRRAKEGARRQLRMLGCWRAVSWRAASQGGRGQGDLPRPQPGGGASGGLVTLQGVVAWWRVRRRTEDGGRRPPGDITRHERPFTRYHTIPYYTVLYPKTVTATPAAYSPGGQATYALY